MKISQNLTTAILLIATPLPTVYSQQDDNASNVQELPAFEATAQQNPVEFGMPTVSVKLDEIDFQKINFINPEDALKYSPILTLGNVLLVTRMEFYPLGEIVCFRMLGR